MLLSRFWYVFLAAAVTAGLAAALLAQGVLNDQRDAALEESLLRDRAALDVQLALEARSRLDRIAFITVDGNFGALLAQAGGTDEQSRLRTLARDVKQRLSGQVKQLTEAKHQPPDLAFAVDRNGRIVAQLGPMSANPPGTSLATYPLVRRTLQGYVRDDMWLYDRKVYRMAGRPVMNGSQYAGAILHGYRLDEALAQQLSNGLQGATVGFFMGNELLAGHTPPEASGTVALETLGDTLPQVLQDDYFTEQGRSDVWKVNDDSRAIFALLPGSTVDAQVGMVVGRPRTVLSQSLALFQSASQQDINELPFFRLALVALFAAGLGLLFMWVEHDRPFASLRQRAFGLLNGEQDRLIITDWSGAYRELADTINQLVETASSKAGLGGSKKRKANLDEILGPTPGESGAQPFFGFAADPGLAPSDDDPFMFATPQPPSDEAPRDPAPPLAPASPPGPPPSARAGGGQGGAGLTAASPAAAPLTNGHSVPSTPVPPPPPHAPAVARAGSPLPPAPPRSAPPEEATAKTPEEIAHYHEVYEAYLATRRECGEPVDHLTYERFEASLEKTRGQLLAKHDARGVKFTVYVKDGKAALKAAAVRS